MRAHGSVAAEPPSRPMPIWRLAGVQGRRWADQCAANRLRQLLTRCAVRQPNARVTQDVRPVPTGRRITEGRGAPSVESGRAAAATRTAAASQPQEVRPRGTVRMFARRSRRRGTVNTKRCVKVRYPPVQCANGAGRLKAIEISTAPLAPRASTSASARRIVPKHRCECQPRCRRARADRRFHAR